MLHLAISAAPLPSAAHRTRRAGAMTDWCPGPCNTAWRKTVGGPICPNACDHPSCHTIRHATTDPWPGEPVWCRRDQARIRAKLAGINTLAALIEHDADGYGEAPGEPGRRSNGHAPSPSPKFDLLDEIERMLRAWEAEYCHVKGWGSPPVHGRYASVSHEIYTFLNRHFDGVMESPFAREFGDEVLAAERQLVGRAKAGTGVRWMPGRCPWCGHLTLFQTEGEEHVACHNPGPPPCRARLTMDEYQSEAARAAS